MLKQLRNISIYSFVSIVLVTVLVVSSLLVIYIVRSSIRNEALSEAEKKAKIILERNLATHSYFSHEIKPSVFPLAEKEVKNGYFEPSWMSSTYAVREIDKLFKEMNEEKYYYKECAINSRSPENEADEYEALFIRRLNSEPELKVMSEVRTIDGVPYFSVIRRGEVMEQACLRCHSEPGAAPAGLVRRYGDNRSFKRHVGEVVSAISIRIPLDYAFAEADIAASRLSLVLIIVISVVLGSVFVVIRRFIMDPVNTIQKRAIDISGDDKLLGEEVPIPPFKELSGLSRAFNRMSLSLRDHLDRLEQKVDERTSELKATNERLVREKENVRVLQGMLPICASCKKIRDDKGYWNQIECYITENSEAFFTHGLCPDCIDRVYPELRSKRKEEDSDDQK